jgi:hypothetical protein
MATSPTRLPGDLFVPGDLNVGGSILPGLARSSLSQDNFVEIGVPFAQLRIWDAFQTPITTAASDDLGLSTGGTYGTNAPYISAGDLKAAGATTRRARFLFTVPLNYVAGQSLRFVAYAGMVTTVADTSCTVDFEAYVLDKDATVGGSDLVTTSATTINSLVFSAKNFDLTATALIPGDVLDVRVSIACTDAATATAVIPAIAYLAVSLDVKG